MNEVLQNSALAITAMMVTIWLISLPIKNVSIVDIGWGAGFVLVGIVSALTASEQGQGRWVLAGMTTLWGTRLTLYLAWRNLGHGEDYRYVAMRKKYPSFALSSFLIVFTLQGVLMWVVSLPVQAGIATAQDGWHPLHATGMLIWVIGLSFESMGDFQLATFKANPKNKGKVFDQGLWRYTRHPNYFGDFMVWWGIYIASLAHSTAYWTAIGPVVMSIFLMKVSGVTLLEKTLAKTKEGYQEYVQSTNAFFPGPKRKLVDQSSSDD
jgi:steroid 5-alpha reductase family enzyme